MLPGPQAYAAFLTQEGYHPRSDKHGDRLCHLVLEDLLSVCEPLRRAAAQGNVVYSLNYDVLVADPSVVAGLSPALLKDLGWNIDLVLGSPKSRQKQFTEPEPAAIRRDSLDEIWLAVDAKGVMTEHGKARRNRQRDVTALSAVMHLFHPSVVVGAAIPINISRRFKSPLVDHGTDHGEKIPQVVADTLAIFRAVRQLAPRLASGGIEGLGCFVVDFENTPGSVAKLHSTPPAPQPGDLIHYDRFISDLASALVQRFGHKM